MEDYEISCYEAIANGTEEVKKGNRWGFVDVLCGANFKPGIGGCFNEKCYNGVIGLEEENLDGVVMEIAAKVEGN